MNVVPEVGWTAFNSFPNSFLSILSKCHDDISWDLDEILSEEWITELKIPVTNEIITSVWKKYKLWECEVQIVHTSNHDLILLDLTTLRKSEITVSDTVDIITNLWNESDFWDQIFLEAEINWEEWILIDRYTLKREN